MNADTLVTRSERRKATEERLLDALETVLVRDGLRQLSLNAIVEEAGVGKPLLYRYFTNLQGLLAAWAERRASFVGDSSGQKSAASAEDNGAFRQQLAEELVASAVNLRDRPIMLEMLAEELTADSDLSEPFAQIRSRQGKPFVRAMLSDPRYSEPELRGKIIILYAAINYLAMRAHRSPRFMGLRLDTDEGWDEAMTMVSRIMVETNDSEREGNT